MSRFRLEWTRKRSFKSSTVREGFRKLLELEGRPRSGRRSARQTPAVALAKKLRPAVVIMDIALPLLNGLEATRQILKTVPSARILILSAHSDDAYVKNARESGAVGFLPKQASAHISARGFGKSTKGISFSARSRRRVFSKASESRWIEADG
jgi:DNA-binding NarL/FixJ family response regulator